MNHNTTVYPYFVRIQHPRPGGTRTDDVLVDVHYVGIRWPFGQTDSYSEQIKSAVLGNIVRHLNLFRFPTTVETFITQVTKDELFLDSAAVFGRPVSIVQEADDVRADIADKDGTCTLTFYLFVQVSDTAGAQESSPTRDANGDATYSAEFSVEAILDRSSDAWTVQSKLDNAHVAVYSNVQDCIVRIAEKIQERTKSCMQHIGLSYILARQNLNGHFEDFQVELLIPDQVLRIRSVKNPINNFSFTVTDTNVIASFTLRTECSATTVRAATPTELSAVEDIIRAYCAAGGRTTGNRVVLEYSAADHVDVTVDSTNYSWSWRSTIQDLPKDLAENLLPYVRSLD